MKLLDPLLQTKLGVWLPIISGGSSNTAYSGRKPHNVVLRKYCHMWTSIMQLDQPQLRLANGVSHQKDMRTQLKLAGWLVIIFSWPSAQQCSANGVCGLVS